MLQDHTHGQIKEHCSLHLFIDGGCEPKNPGGSATSGWVLFSSKKQENPLAEQGEVVQVGGPLATNNYGEYKALILALTWLDQQNWRGDLSIKADSKLLVEQVSGRWQIKAEHLKPLRQEIWDLMNKLNLHQVNDSEPMAPDGMGSCYINHIFRKFNDYANKLCRKAYKEQK